MFILFKYKTIIIDVSSDFHCIDSYLLLGASSSLLFKSQRCQHFDINIRFLDLKHSYLNIKFHRTKKSCEHQNTKSICLHHLPFMFPNLLIRESTAGILNFVYLLQVLIFSLVLYFLKVFRIYH